MEEDMLTKHLALALLGTTLIAFPALAQTNPPAGSTTAPPAGSTAAPAQMGGGNWMTQEQPGQWRASKLEGLDVYNQSNEKIGDISELLVDSSGKIQAVVVGVGGFLGMGERDVAQWRLLQMLPPQQRLQRLRGRSARLRRPPPVQWPQTGPPTMQPARLLTMRCSHRT
jgi:hypothetical protein